MFNRVLSVTIWVALAALAVTALVVPAAGEAAPGLLVGAASAGVLVWALLWAPFVAVDDDRVTIANVVVEYRVPWAAVIHVETRYSLLVHTPGRRISATAAPAPGAMAGVRAARAHRRSEAASAPGIRPSDLPTTDSGRAADLVRRRWQEGLRTGRVESGVAGETPVAVSPRTLSVAAILAGVAGLVCAALLI